MPTKPKKSKAPAAPPVVVPAPPQLPSPPAQVPAPPVQVPAPPPPAHPFFAPSSAGVPLSLLQVPIKPPAERKTSNYQATATAMRDELWPDVPDEALWLVGARDKKRKGFCQVPRTLPLLMNIINDASKQVGKQRAVPAGRAYLALWCRDFGQAVVRVDNETVMASEAGYTGERSVSTWREHLRVLEDLGFIKTQAGPAGPAQWVLLMNPYNVVRELKNKGWIQMGPHAALIQRTIEVGGRADVTQ